jgi:hypothetical protein
MPSCLGFIKRPSKAPSIPTPVSPLTTTLVSLDTYALNFTSTSVPDYVDPSPPAQQENEIFVGAQVPKPVTSKNDHDSPKYENHACIVELGEGARIEGYETMNQDNIVISACYNVPAQVTTIGPGAIITASNGAPLTSFNCGNVVIYAADSELESYRDYRSANTYLLRTKYRTSYYGANAYDPRSKYY